MQDIRVREMRDRRGRVGVSEPQLTACRVPRKRISAGIERYPTWPLDPE